MQLWNKLNKEELEAQLRDIGHQYMTISFYQYAQIPNPHLFRDHLFLMWSKLEVVGRTYIAAEGINAQIAVPTKNISDFREELYQIEFLNGIRLNFAVDESEAEFTFLKLKIKVRDKILADGLNDKNFDVTQKGKHLNAEEFNALTNDPETLLIDFRNHYESEVGYFDGAICPDVDTFRDSLPLIEEKILKGNENKNIVMYCTGGIRCEKSTAYLKSQGYKDVFHLQGGILKYLEEVNEDESLWEGECFVFDDRVAVKHNLEQGQYDQCHACRFPITKEDTMHPHYEKGASCPRCFGTKNSNQMSRYREREKQVQLAKKRGEEHIGDEAIVVKNKDK